MEDSQFYAKLLRKIPPYFDKDNEYLFDPTTGYIYMVENGKSSEYPLRTGLAGYLWMCLYVKGYIERLDDAT